MPTLFSYCIPVDDGAAPNPFWGICTLVICKPVIRRIASIGDWIVGTGSANSPIGNISDKVVYAMKVTKIMKMNEYDSYCHKYLPNKIPEWKSSDIKRRVGDSIYDYSNNPPKMRKSVHNELNRERDLRGENALLSEHFYYFGNNPISLPNDLKPIIKSGRAHKSISNNPYIKRFIQWIDSQKLSINTLYGNPQFDISSDESMCEYCSKIRYDEANEDELLSNSCY